MERPPNPPRGAKPDVLALPPPRPQEAGVAREVGTVAGGFIYLERDAWWVGIERRKDVNQTVVPGQELCCWCDSFTAWLFKASCFGAPAAGLRERLKGSKVR